MCTRCGFSVSEKRSVIRTLMQYGQGIDIWLACVQFINFFKQEVQSDTLPDLNGEVKSYVGLKVY